MARALILWLMGVPLFVVLLHNLASALLLAVTVNAVRGADAISR